MVLKCLPVISQQSKSKDIEGKTEEVDIAVNVDCGKENSAENWKFRVSDENNGDVYYIFISDTGFSSGNRKLTLRDAKGNDQLDMLYLKGLGVVQLFEPKGQLIGECNSVVGFQCLSLKVKYLFVDIAGELIFKLKTDMHPYSNEHSFKLRIKNSSNQLTGYIKMGRVKNCCHIKMSLDTFTSDERKWIVALWATFMNYELLENEDNNEEINPDILQFQV